MYWQENHGFQSGLLWSVMEWQELADNPAQKFTRRTQKCSLWSYIKVVNISRLLSTMKVVSIN